MTNTNHLSDLWEHTIVKVFKHDSKSELGLMFKQWIIFNKLETFNSILKYPIDDFTPSGNLCYMNKHGDILPYTPMKKIFNLRWYIQHLMDENEDEAQNPLSECKFMKYVIHHRHPMTPEQLKQKPFEEIFKNQHEKVDTEEGESNEEEEEFTTSEKLTKDEYSTFSDMSRQDSTSHINVHDTQDEQISHTPETLQIHNTYITTMHDIDDLIHDENNTSEDENIIEIETYEDYGEKIHETEESIPVETSQVLTVFNKTIHHEDDSSDDKSVIEIESPEENREQEIGKQDKLLTTKFQIEIENRKVEGLITYSTDQQIFKFKVNSWGVNIEFTLYELKCTIHAILQHMGFYHTTDNPCVMMRANHETKSCEYIIFHQNELYIASSTLQEILHIVKEKYNIKINSNDYLGSDFPYDPGGTMICCLQFQLDTHQITYQHYIHKISSSQALHT